MPPIRLILRLVALALILGLGACSSLAAPKAEPGMKPGIDALIKSVGVRPDGNLATPTQNPWEDVGWYDLGPHPGGYPAVFWQLRDLQVSDDVQVTHSAG